MRRSRPRRVSSRQAKKNREFEAARPHIYMRSEGRCEVVLEGERCGRLATQIHHILPRGRGGGNEHDNLLATCEPHHSWIHGHPEDAKLFGYLRSAWDVAS